MKLGTETGSLTNHIYSRMTKDQPRPERGMGATILGWTDRHAATIITVLDQGNGKWLIQTQEDHAKRIDTNGMSESQDYEYSANPDGALSWFRFEPGKGWREVRRNDKGRWLLTGGNGVRIGERRAYRDFSF